MIAFEDALKIVLNSAVCTTEIEEVENAQCNRKSFG